MGRSKGGSGAKNGRDSNAKRLGVKKYGGELVTAGSVLVRQRGTHIHPGDNVKRGGDDTLYAIEDGKVVYAERKNRKIVSVEAVAEEK
ncbi:MAG TPA: 50S ribosomal protein L27 [Treponema sp.]|jgi:large subunit ribosomal protein L27|nr:50S ribosomal protein L27 [Treponema sp.]HAK68351.1 50S ribosomal protein L27 [Treponema sp.]HBB42649.1 50S ribosomal protein L27 [Treponema sp.]HCA20299.1 50S ribosomal protein L27 [Treponema sp.]